MKLKKIIASVLLTLGCVAGTATAINSFGANPPKETVAASEKTYYLDTSYIVTKLSWWKTSDTWFSYQKGTNDYPKKKMTQITETLFKYTTSDTVLNFEFYVYNTGSNQNKTVWRSPDGDKNYFYINSGNGSALQTYEAGYYYEDQEVTNVQSKTTKRVWFKNNVSWWASDKAVEGIRYWDNSGNKKYTKVTKVNNSKTSEDFCYADIDINATGYSAVRRIPNTQKPAYWNLSSDIVKFKTTVAYIPADNTMISYGNPDKVSVEFALKYFEGYSTCSEHEDNGFKNINDLENNLFSKLASEDVAVFNETKIENNAFTVAQKIQTMQMKYNEHLSSAKTLGIFNTTRINNTSSNTVVVISLVILAVTVTLYFVLRKKKENI